MMSNPDEVGGYIIFDCPKEKGIELIFPVGGDCSNMKASVFMVDEDAQKFINIIQNKINARI